jgi:acyl carrier protein
MATIPIQDIAKLVGMLLGLDHVLPGDLIVEDLGAESADIVNIIVAVEDKYQIEIDESSLPDIKTVEELHSHANRISEQKTSGEQ